MGLLKWPIEKSDFLSSVSKPVPVLIQKLPFNNYSVQDFHRNKDKNLRNKNTLGSSYCFSCRSFACRCLASLSWSHILLFWWVTENATGQSKKTLNFYRLTGIGLLFTAYSKLGVPLLGQVASYSLFQTWGSRCWDRFAIYSFAKLWVPTGTRLIMQPLAGSLLACMGEIVGHVCRHFRIHFVESRFLGGGGGGV